MMVLEILLLASMAVNIYLYIVLFVKDKIVVWFKYSDGKRKRVSIDRYSMPHFFMATVSQMIKSGDLSKYSVIKGGDDDQNES